MATIDTTLDFFKVPGIDTFVNAFGTKKPSGKGLTTEEVASNVAAVFMRQRPFVVTETSNTLRVDANSLFLITAPEPIVLTLAEAAFVGCEVTIINSTPQTQTIKATYHGTTEQTVDLVPAKQLKLVYLTTGWQIRYPDELIAILQTGYIQWPGMPSPLEIPALHFVGYSWHEVNYDGNFFRAKGRNAKAFSAKKLTKEQIKNGLYIFQDDEQCDAIRNIKGTLGKDKYDSFVSWSSSLISGVLGTNKNFGQYGYTPGSGGTDNCVLYYKNITFDASKAAGVNVAEENRSRNLTFVIWALVKDEED